jgi:Lar family restriction alleviation protein
MSDIRLSKCPFCGGDGKLVHMIKPKTCINGSVIVCGSCESRGEWFPVDTAYSCDDKAAEAWNRRA